MPATKFALEVHQALCLPRNLHFEVHEICTSRFTKCCACHEICTSRFTKCCTCHELWTSRFTKCCTCREICTSRFTKCCALRLRRNLHFEVHQVQCLPRNLHFDVHQALCLPRNLQTSHMPKVTVQSAAPATKTAFRSKATPIPCTCHEKATFEHQNTRLPLRLPRKVTTMCENAHGATTRGQLLEAPTAATQIRRACAVEVHMDDVVSHECTLIFQKSLF